MSPFLASEDRQEAAPAPRLRFAASSSRSRDQLEKCRKAPAVRSRSQAVKRPQPQAGGTAELRVSPGTGADRAEDGPAGDKEPGSLSAQDGSGRLWCGLELPELKELVSLMRYSSNNLNQLTRRVHETGRIYDADLEDISQRQEAVGWGAKGVDPAGKAVVTRGIAPAVRECRRVRCAGPPSFLCPYRCGLGPQAYIRNGGEG